MSLRIEMQDAYYLPAATPLEVNPTAGSNAGEAKRPAAPIPMAFDSGIEAIAGNIL